MLLHFRTVLLLTLTLVTLMNASESVSAQDSDGDGRLDLIDVPSFDPDATGIASFNSLGIEDLTGANLLTGVVDLRFDFNKVARIENDDINQLATLESLSLVGNPITNIDNGSFRGLTGLKNLFLPLFLGF